MLVVFNSGSVSLVTILLLISMVFPASSFKFLRVGSNDPVHLLILGHRSLMTNVTCADIIPHDQQGRQFHGEVEARELFSVANTTALGPAILKSSVCLFLEFF